ncbi:MAG: aldo/keto reductase [Halobacteriota archaeon]
MTGVVPDLGLGTSRNTDPEQCAESVRTAIEVGYRHVDTAQMYGNEAPVGEGLATADVSRDEVFLATKVDPANLASDDVRTSTEESLDRLGVDYVDLLYVHWPVGAYDPQDTLPAFDELRDDGLIRHVGVSNFTVDLLEEATRILDSPIVANQIEVHPMLPPQPNLTEFSRAHDVDQVAYSPLCRGEALDLPEVRTVADKHGVTPARAILAWLLSKDFRVIPKSVGEGHIRDNFEALTLSLDDEDIDRLDGVERRKRRFDHEDAPWNR